MTLTPVPQAAPPRRPAHPPASPPRAMIEVRPSNFGSMSRVSDAGGTTAEYAITTLAACGFAALLVVVLKSGAVKGLLSGVIASALKLGS